MTASAQALRISVGIVLLQFLSLSALSAMDALVVYREGQVDIDRRGGDRIEAYIGDEVRGGDSVITGVNGFAELERGNSTSITVEPDTVFSVDSVGDTGQERDVLRCTLGSISYRFDRIAGASEPRITTPSAAAGVRGTELTVAAGEDGSSLFVVQSGEVEVEAEGQTVLLGPDEGVEVRPGEAPGEKFEVKRGQIDYSNWRQERRDAFIDDPVAAARGLERRFDGFVEKVNDLAPKLQRKRSQLENEKAKLSTIKEEQGEEARIKHYREVIFPLEVEIHDIYVTLKYYAKSALSIRRFVLGRMYLSLKTQNLEDLSNEKYQDFLLIHERIIYDFEKQIVPQLVEAELL
mgnify:FL=1